MNKDKKLFEAVHDLFYEAQRRKETRTLLYAGLSSSMKITMEYIPAKSLGHDPVMVIDEKATLSATDEKYLRPFYERSKKD